MTETVVENTPKHATDYLEINFRSGEHAPAPPRLFSHAQVHLSLDSYGTCF